MKSKAFLIFGFLAVIWAVEILNGFLGHRLNTWGIRPRSELGLIGIPLSPFLHGSYNHVLSNTIPFLVLGGLVAFRGIQKLVGVSLFIVLAGGGAVWLLGRMAIPVGDSGLVFGVLPTQSFVSWEAHLFGLMAGVMAARLTRKRPTPTGP